LIALLTALKGVPFTHARDVAGEAILPVWGALETTSSVLSILPGLLKSLSFRLDRMKELSGAYFSTVTDLVDIIVREKGLSFRTAHHIVAGMVDTMLRTGRKPEEITARIVDEEAAKVVGHPIRLKESLIRSALLPEACVERRSLPGGTASAEVSRMVEKARRDLLKEEKELKKRREKRRKAEALLLKTALHLAAKRD
jgi:argininosuccinate lyase